MIVMPANNTGIRTGILVGRYPGRLAHLFSPGAQRGPFGPDMEYALDNGVFGLGDKWEEGPWFDLLDWARLSGQNLGGRWWPTWLQIVSGRCGAGASMPTALRITDGRLPSPSRTA